MSVEEKHVKVVQPSAGSQQMLSYRYRHSSFRYLQKGTHAHLCVYARPCKQRCLWPFLQPVSCTFPPLPYGVLHLTHFLSYTLLPFNGQFRLFVLVTDSFLSGPRLSLKISLPYLFPKVFIISIIGGDFRCNFSQQSFSLLILGSVCQVCGSRTDIFYRDASAKRLSFR